MASLQSIDDKTVNLIKQSFPNVDVSESDLVKVSGSIFKDDQYTTPEKAEIEQWLITANHISSPSEDAAKTAERLSSLNTHLSTRTTLLGSKPSIADISLYSRLSPVIKTWDATQRTGERGHHHVVRHADFVQNSPLFGPLKIAEADKVSIDPSEVLFVIPAIDPKAEKERKKKEKEAAAAAAASATSSTAKSALAKGVEQAKSTGDKIAAAVGAETPLVPASGGGRKKDKKEKSANNNNKAPKAADQPKPLSPSLIDLRVAHILKATTHPNADSLYVSTIAMGDPEGTPETFLHEGQVCRTVCSGLNGLVPLEEMQNRMIVAVCNLKPVTMRGIKSAAMVLAASPRDAEAHAGPVELVAPPEGAKAGERVFFKGWTGEPEGVLNPKKKVWETIQPGFTTTEDLGVAFDPSVVEQLKDNPVSKQGVARLVTEGGLCTVKSLKGATVR